MHEKILQGVTVGVVSGLFVYWLTTRRQYGTKEANPHAYMPLTGDVRKIHNVSGTSACCQCCGLPTPDTTSTPLAADYLNCAPEYNPATSEWNIGVSMNLNCGLCGKVYVDKMAASQPAGVRGPNTVPTPRKITGPIQCNPCLPGQVCCSEVI